MNYFSGRRFGEVLSGSSPAPTPNEQLSFRNEGSFEPIFESLLPRVQRWVSDRHGHVRAIEGGSASFGKGFDSAIAGLGWRGILHSRGVRKLIRAAMRSSRPEPVAVHIWPGTAEQRRVLIRMARYRGHDGGPLWFGTVEDIQDHEAEEARALKAALSESEQHYRFSVDLSPIVPWTASPAGEIEEAGPLWENLTGMSIEESLGTGWVGALHPDDLDTTLAVWAEHLQSGEPVDLSYRIRMRDGLYRWMRARAAARRDEEGAILRWYGMLEDVNDAVLAEQELAESEERFRLAIHSAGIGIWDFDIATGHRTWSNEFKTMLGVPLDAAPTAELALSLVHPEDRPVLAGMMAAVANQTLPPHFEATLRVHRADNGEMRWIRSTGWTTESNSGGFKRVIVTFQDVTEERDAEQRIRWVATHDPLTRLPNRALWQTTLEDLTEKAQEAGQRFGLMLFDIDDLKRTNDTLGHDAGDALLCNFAERLVAAAPEDAMLGRLGGDEFGLVAPSLADSKALQACAEALLVNLRRPYSYDGQPLECGVSIGGALFREHGEDAQDVLKAADLALYASKASGRGRLTLFHSALRAEAQQRSSMIQMGREAVEQDLIVPYYQPKVDLATGQVLGYEALLRWHHPRLGLQLPGSIAAAFDHAEIAVAITERMLDSVLRDIRGWLDRGFDPGRVAINASSADFMRNDFADYVFRQLADHGVPARHLEIEVTETVFLGRGTEHVERTLSRFSTGGVRVALDDFGTGYASLTHLKQYPVDVLKIDWSFIRDLEEDSGDVAIVDAIVKLGSSLGIEVVAEGVETEAQRDLLLHHGCHIGQGFLMGRPQARETIHP